MHVYIRCIESLCVSLFSLCMYVSYVYVCAPPLDACSLSWGVKSLWLVVFRLFPFFSLFLSLILVVTGSENNDIKRDDSTIGVHAWLRLLWLVLVWGVFCELPHPSLSVCPLSSLSWNNMKVSSTPFVLFVVLFFFLFPGSLKIRSSSRRRKRFLHLMECGWRTTLFGSLALLSFFLEIKKKKTLDLFGMMSLFSFVNLSSKEATSLLKALLLLLF